jgi:pimeloyl-ACP methyl ester carboxylesterase
LYVQFHRVHKLAVWEREGAGPPILLVHATGFHARLWKYIIEQLPGRRSIAFDLRGHGASDKDFGSYAWRRFGEDTAAVARAFDLRGAVGVGHSIGGHAMALAAALAADAFSRLLLIDPVIKPSAEYHGGGTDVEFILRRRAQWKSAQEMHLRFSQRPPFSSWKPEILRDYCEYGLLPAGEGFTLACPPEIEASIYPQWNAPEANLDGELRRIHQPTEIWRSGRRMSEDKFDLSASATDPLLASRMPEARDTVLEDCSHFIPMERPDLVVEALR